MARAPRRLLLSLATVLLASPASAQTIIEIDNGLAPPDPDNVVTAGEVTGSDSLRVRDGGCAGEPNPCPTPGPSTTVDLQANVNDAHVYDSSALLFSSGNVNDIASANNDATLVIDGGIVDFSLIGNDQSTVRIDGGGTGEFAITFLNDDSSFEMTGGFAEWVDFSGSSSGSFQGGRVGNVLEASEDATVSIEGGFIGWSIINGSRVVAEDQAVIIFTGGSLGAAISAEDGGTIYLFGTGFEVNGSPVSYGAVAPTTGNLTGTLEDGTSLSTIFERVGTGSQILLVPEPATGVLLGGGLLALSASRRRRVRRSTHAG